MKGHQKLKFATFAGLALLLSNSAFAQSRPKVEPFVFIGTADECGGTGGSAIVTSGWLPGMGFKDGSRRGDRREGLLLSKNGPTSNCSSAGAEVKFEGTTISELEFAYRDGGHCNNGSPRFNITTPQGTYFAGCARGQSEASDTDSQWKVVRFADGVGIVDPAGNLPPFVFGETEVTRLLIIHDEGTDQTDNSDPNGVGLTILDKINVNGKVARDGACAVVPTESGQTSCDTN